MVHRIETAVATIEHGRIRYSARWLCSGGSPDIVMLANADAHDDFRTEAAAVSLPRFNFLATSFCFFSF